MLFVSESTSGCCLVCLKIDTLVLPLSRHCVQTRNERAAGDFFEAGVRSENQNGRF